MSDVWASVVGRPMFATELVRHLPGAAAAHLRDGSLRGFVSDAYSRQNQSFLAARYSDREYLADELTEEALGKEIFTYVDDEDPAVFKSRIEDDIRRRRVRQEDAVLSMGFTSAFGEDMHPDDMLHCFEIARLMRATVSGDSANHIATCLNDELDCVASRVGEVYQDVLGRDPDAAEIRDEIPLFREHVPASFYTAGWGDLAGEELSDRFGPAADELRFRLHRSLEFHDVLKRIISEKTGWR